MINKKTAVLLTVLITFAFSLATFLITFFAIKYAPNENINAAQYQIFKKYSQIEKIEDIIKKDYYKEVNEGMLVDGALKGMVASLGDPYSAYYNKEEFKKYSEKMNGKYTGIGVVIRIDPKDGLAVVVEVYKNSPAQEAGVKAGDKLLSADGEKLSGMNLETIAEKILGLEGSKLSLSILQDEKEKTLEITRRPVEITTITKSMLNGDIGRINISQFSGNCVEDFYNAIKDLKKQNAKGVIVDLRNNPGGMLADVCKILDSILPEGTIVYTQNKEGKKETFTSDANYWDIPMVVLVNGSSASASEVFAGAVQDYGRAKLVGVKTFGKGIVQTIEPIPETGAGIKLTTSHYYTPKGRNINGLGIIPDYIVELELKAGEELTLENDTQLKKALEILNSKNQ